MRYSRAFTIVEVLVVIVIIVILATITTILSSQTQIQARDAKRKADVTSLKSGLEKYFDKNGEYPSSCTQAGYNTSTRLCADRPLGYLVPSNNPPLNSSTTLSNLDTILRMNADAVKDPLSSAATPLGAPSAASTANTFFYVYVGDLTNSSATTATNIQPFQLNINGVSCTYRVTVAPGKQTSFVLGYFSEKDKKIHIVTGDRNARPTIPTGQPCVIEEI